MNTVLIGDAPPAPHSEAADALTGSPFVTPTAAELEHINSRLAQHEQLNRRDATRLHVVAPTNAEEAKPRLDDLTKNKNWSDRLMAGEASAHREFDALCEMIAAGQPLNPFAANARDLIPDFQTVGDGEMPFAESVRHVEALREIGMPDVLIREAMTGLDANTGKPFTPEMVERARQAKRIMESPGGYDPTDVTQRNRMMAVNIILADAGG